MNPADRRQAPAAPIEPQALLDLMRPVDDAVREWPRKSGRTARNHVFDAVRTRGLSYQSWDEATWAEVSRTAGPARLHIIALGHSLGGHHRLHHTAGINQLRRLADLVFGSGATEPALREVEQTLSSWQTSAHLLEWQVGNAVLDALLSAGSPRLEDLTDTLVRQLVAEYDKVDGLHSRRRGLIKLSRVLASKGIIPAPLHSNENKAGPRSDMLSTVPPQWAEWALRWRKYSTHEPGTIRSMFSVILIAGRWAAEKHPDVLTPDQWTRDMAAEYVADTMQATVGQWAGHNRNRSRFGQPISAAGRAMRIDSIRGFFCDLIEWEWIKPRFDPRRAMSMPLSLRAQMGPNPRIIDDASWAKLMAAGLTLNAEDLKPYGSGRARKAGWKATYYPVEMVRAMVGVWLFGGCRIDEIRRLELDCVTWDEGTDDTTGQPFTICLLHIPQNKTSRPFNKPVDPVVGQLIDAWKMIRPPQPDLIDRKTGQKRQHLFCHRGQLVGKEYLNHNILPALCRKAGIPQTDSRGALTSHRARATIATQLLNARDPLTLNDLQQWLGHKHPASTRYYAAILQRTLTAAYKKADYFARNVRTIQVLIDRESILTGAAAGGEQPWKYYDLGEGYCSYDFFAKCPHRLACARCPFYVPKQSSRGQLLAVKDGIDQMLEQLDLTDDEREALEGDREAVTALAKRLADTPTPAGPTPRELGTDDTFIPLTQLMQRISPDKGDEDSP
ncbi:tyrosine-type recombinase/integrase [Streptomyces coelicoflavus]|uniref:Tyrosine-type recombinase/integrase n=2 Tax=Streptomyces TaxID=1883 RepID=A0ABU2REJ4_9ACTN|nr:MULTISPECIES: tyrosine-type recombinase/integrase [unclassified Streptomyces]MDT0427209.1 tyrosine-type recombinase/integrase [Streptomyces sp. DSM 41770]REH18327.1 phage integrase family protein [Streptomyces sp. 2221.1]WDI21565.1 tyrosine-type recombinase/integrase [Streptomyces enissocaesilis]SDS18822.1 Phage integrase family protein [Streptomyces sp. 2114.2]